MMHIAMHESVGSAVLMLMALDKMFY